MQDQEALARYQHYTQTLNDSFSNAENSLDAMTAIFEVHIKAYPADKVAAKMLEGSY